jgi:hypothetical protein
MNEVFIIVGMQLSIFVSVLLLVTIYFLVALEMLMWALVHLGKILLENTLLTIKTYRTAHLIREHNLQPKV